MDRSRNQPGSPDGGEHRAPDKDSRSVGGRWGDALQNLRSMAREPKPAPAPARSPAPSSFAPSNPAPSAADIEAALDALQVLARRHHADAAGSPPVIPPDLEDDPFPRRPASPYAASDAAAAHAAALPAPADAAEWAANDDLPVGVPRKRARWASTALIVASAAVLAVLLVGALSLSRQLFHSAETAAPPSQDAAGPVADTAVQVPAAGALDLPAIEKAMADCDAEAAKRPDALYFLILPVLSPIKNYQPWVAASVGEIGSSVILLPSRATLGGLREGSLTLYRGQYTFSIIDASSEATQSWGPTAGVARFAKLDAAQIAGFRVRFGFADFVGDTPSNFRFPRQKGVCYWVSALLRN